MAGDHRLEIKEGFRRIGRAFHVHREMSAGTQDANIRLVQVIEHLHIRHHIGVAGNIDRMAFARDHIARFGPAINRAMRAGHGR